MPPQPLVSLRNAGRQVGDRWVWRGLDVDVWWPDKPLAVRGASGAGKTLLLRALAGLDTLDEGELLANGEPVSNLPHHRATVAYVAQRPALFDGTVRDNLQAPFAFAAQPLAYSEASALDMLQGLGREPDLLDQSVDSLSGGEAATVGLVRALLTQPSVLLLDEPTAGLDLERTAAVERIVEGFLVTPPRGAVWTSHDAAQLGRVTTRALDL